MMPDRPSVYHVDIISVGAGLVSSVTQLVVLYTMRLHSASSSMYKNNGLCIRLESLP